MHHADEAIGCSISGTCITLPLWVEPLTALLQLLAVLVGIGVGISTWQLNRAKKKALEKGGKKS